MCVSVCVRDMCSHKCLYACVCKYAYGCVFVSVRVLMCVSMRMGGCVCARRVFTWMFLCMCM